MRATGHGAGMPIRLGPLAAALVAAGLFVGALPRPGLAQTALETYCANPPGGALADPDNDGLTTSEECNGFNTGAGLASVPIFVPRCIGNGDEVIGSTTRNNCLDPRTPDWFVCLVRTTPTLIPSDPFRFVYKPVAQGGLGLAVHEVPCSALGPNREVTTTQKAQKGNENASTTPGDFGVATVGTPNHLLAGCTVWTTRIRNWANARFTSGDHPEVYEDLIRHVTAHECAGHGLALTAVYDPTIGNHHPASAKVMMSQYVTYKRTTVFTPTTYTPTTDPVDYLLR